MTTVRPDSASTSTRAAIPSCTPKELICRYPANLVGQLFLSPPELFSVLVDTWMWLYALAYALCAILLLAWLLLPLLRASPHARFGGPGMLIALLPIRSSVPVYRSLWFVGFGAIALLALFVERFRSLEMSLRRLQYSAVAAGGLMVIQIGISPARFVSYNSLGNWIDGMLDSRRARLPDEGDPQSACWRSPP